MKKTIPLFLAILISNFILASNSLYELSVNQRISSSSLIVEGEVVEQLSFWNSQHNRIYTSNKIKLTRIMKGHYSDSIVYVQTEGGWVGNTIQTTSSLLDLRIGEFGIFFCNLSTKDPNPNRSDIQYEVYGSKQGFLKYSKNGSKLADPFQLHSTNAIELAILNSTGVNFTTLSTHSFIFNTIKVLNVLSFSPSTITAGTKSTLTITGTGFGTSGASSTDYVEFPDANYGGAIFYQTDLGDYISWSDTLIQLYVPSRAGTGQFNVVVGGNTVVSSNILNITYSQVNVSNGINKYKPYHINDNGFGGYTWQKSVTVANNNNLLTSFELAFNKWRCATGINWEIGSSIVYSNINAMNGVNLIGTSNSLPAGVLGVCTSYSQACNGGTEWYVTELDIFFDIGTSWYYGTGTPPSNRIDFETVALHELGHGHLLGHVINTSDIMHFAISSGTFNRILSFNNITAGNYIMGQSIATNNCSQPPHITNFPGSCAPLAPSDGAIYASNPLTDDLCVGNYDIYADLYNFGVDTIFNATIGWSINNNIQPSFNWLGAIPSGDNLIDINIANEYFGDTIHNIKIWVTDVNGILETNTVNDTAFYTFEPFYSPVSIQPFVASAVDTICSGTLTTININSPMVGAYYSLIINDSLISGPSYSSSANIIYLYPGIISQTTPFEVVGYVANQCDTAFYTYYDTIVIATEPHSPLPAIVQDTLICSGDSTNILLSNSQIGLTYQLTLNGQPFGGELNGNGGVLQFPTDALSNDVTLNMEIENITFGCVYTPSDSIKINIDEVISDFVIDVNQIILDSIVIINNSLSDSYLWNFDIGAITDSDTIETPSLMYNSYGTKLIELICSTEYGCTDTSQISLEIFDSITNGPGTLCWDSTLNSTSWGIGVNGESPRVLDMHLDKFGNTYIVGTKSSYIAYKSRLNQFLWKIDKNGNLLIDYKLTMPIIYGNNGYNSSYCNTVTTDSKKNIYVGGAFGGESSINFAGVQLDATYSNRMTGYIVKLDSNGIGQWGITFNSNHLRETGVTDVIYQDDDHIYVSILGNQINAIFPDGSNENLGGDVIILDVNSMGEYNKHIFGGGNQVSSQPKKVVGMLGFNCGTTIYLQKTTVSPKMHLSETGKIYLVGTIQRQCNFGAYTIGDNSTNNYKGFAAVIDTSFQWQNAVVTHEETKMGQHYGSSGCAPELAPVFTFDSDDNLYYYVNWRANNTSQMSIVLSGTSYTSLKGSAFVKLDENLNLKWINLNGNESYNHTKTMRTNKFDEILFLGDYIDFQWFSSQNTSNKAIRSEAGKDFYIGALDTTGNMSWIRNIGSAGNDSPILMDINECGDMKIYGAITDSINFDSSLLGGNSNPYVLLDYSISGDCSSPCFRFDALQNNDSTYCRQPDIVLNWDNYYINTANLSVSIDNGISYQIVEIGADISSGSYNLTLNDSLFIGQWVILKSEVPSIPISDSIWLYLEPLTSLVDIGSDTIICDGTFIDLDAGPNYSSYVWNVYIASQTLEIGVTQIINVGNEHNYIVSATDNYGCIYKDSLQVTIATVTDVILNNSSITYCHGDSVELIGGDFPSYYWWAGPYTTQSIFAFQPGGYSLTVIDTIGCEYIESTYLTEVNYNYIMPENDTACAHNAVEINAGSNGNSYTYAWSTGENTNSVETYTSGDYSVIITDTISGCSFYDTTSVFIDACTSIDENNINFKVFPNPIIDYLNLSFEKDQEQVDLWIYNNLGELIIYKQSSNIKQININLKDLSTGIYVLKYAINQTQGIFKFLKE